MPTVSVITPSYKSKKFILETLLSIKNQTYSDFEVIVVDDASPDESADYICSILPDERFRLIRLEQNVGAAEARNEGLRAAKGRYIAFLDADDLWRPEKLEKQLDFMAEKDASFSFAAYEVISETGEVVRGCISVPGTITKKQYLGNTIIGCLTVMIDVPKFSQKVLMPNLRSSHDMALWVNLLSETGIAYGYQDVLASYRLVSNSNTSKKSKAAREVWQVYRNYLNYSLLKSSFYFVRYAANAVLRRGSSFF
jgi:teichuronic acid biosynthesis glycosyltransferase TuaG